MAKVVESHDPLIAIKNFLKQNPGVEEVEMESEENPDINRWYNIAKKEIHEDSTAWNDFCAEMGHIPENVAHMTSVVMDFGEWLEKNRATEYNPEPDALTQTDAADFGHVDVILVTVQKEGHPDKVTLASQIFFDEEKQIGQYWLTEPFSKKRIVVQFTEKEIWEGRKALFQFIADGGNLRSVIENPSTMVQTILFDKRKWDEKSAKSWLKKHDFKIALEDYDTWKYMRARQERPGKFRRFRTRDITDGILFTFGVLGKKNPCQKNPSDIIYAKIVRGADSISLTPYSRNIYLLYSEIDDRNVCSGTLEEMIHEMNEFVNKYGWKWETKPRRDSHQENPEIYRIWVRDVEQDVPEYRPTDIFFHDKKQAETFANIETVAGMSEEYEARIHKGVLPKDANFEYSALQSKKNPAQPFEEWKKKVDSLCWSKLGVSCDDLPDIPYYDYYESGYSPSKVVSILRRENLGD